jgi:hypothetical protein
MDAPSPFSGMAVSPVVTTPANARRRACTRCIVTYIRDKRADK